MELLESRKKRAATTKDVRAMSLPEKKKCTKTKGENQTHRTKT